MSANEVNDPALAIPVLASLDISQSRDFYTKQLGFSEIVYETPQYLIVRRQQLELHFWLAPDRIHPENTSCYIRGGQVPALYQEFRQRNISRLSVFEVKPWNMKEFTIHDPHGNLLRFGCAPEEVE